MATFLGVLADHGAMWDTSGHIGTDAIGRYVDLPVSTSVPAGSAVAIVWHSSPGTVFVVSAEDANGNSWDYLSAQRVQQSVEQETIGVISDVLTAPLASSVRVRFFGTAPSLFQGWILGYADATGDGGWAYTAMGERYFDLAHEDSTPDIEWEPLGNGAVGIVVARQEVDAVFASWRDPDWSSVASHASTTWAFNRSKVIVGHRLNAVPVGGEHFGGVFASPERRTTWRAGVAVELVP